MIPRDERRRNDHARRTQTDSYVPDQARDARRPHIDSYMPDRAAQVRQGECYDYNFDQTRINIYQLVDSWRSYRNDAVNLQSLTNAEPSQSQAVLNRVYQPEPQGLDAAAPSFHSSHLAGSHYTPYQPLRSVHNYARYPTYRVNKQYRVSDGTREREIIQLEQRAMEVSSQHTTPRYSFRRRRPDQIAPFTSPVSRDTPLPSIEASNAHGTLTASSARAFGTGRRRTATPQVESPPPPVASDQYKRNAGLPPALRPNPQKLLVVLDLNGTLLVRPNRKAPKKFILRPGVTELLDYLFENHVIMVYSSAMPENTVAMVDSLIPPVRRKMMAGVWGRDKLDLTKAQYTNKVQVYKKLQKIWNDKTIQKKADPAQKWDQSNTVLVDDSQLKALSQPHNLLQVPEFENNAPKKGGQALRAWQLQQQEIVKSVEQKLEELKWQVDVSRLIREWQSGTRQAPGVVDETVDQKAHRSIDERAPSPTPSVGQGPAAEEQLMSPRSPPLSKSGSSDNEGGGGADLDDSGVSTMDGLMRNLDHNLNIENSPDADLRRSESPIDESVWSEMLSGGAPASQNSRKTRGKGKGKEQSPAVKDVPPTPESMGP